MSRSRFVKPEVTRLFLADVYKRALQELISKTGKEKATPDQVLASEALVREAVDAGDFIDVKTRLNAGEQRTMFARMASHMTPGESIRLDSEQVGMTKVLEYLVGWSFTDDGKPVPMTPDMSLEARRATLNSLGTDDFGEILAAIEAHEDAVTLAREAEKNGKGGGRQSSATSPSQSTTAGDTNGLTNLTPMSSTS